MNMVKGRYNGVAVIFENLPSLNECDAIVNFPDISATMEPVVKQSDVDDGSLAYLFKNYVVDGIRESVF